MIKTPAIKVIIPGTDEITSIRNTKPEIKSIQLAKSFRNPRKDFAIKKKAQIISTFVGKFNWELNIKNSPDKVSIAPSILTSMFFKSHCHLKM